jgi:hypothetical protein
MLVLTKQERLVLSCYSSSLIFYKFDDIDKKLVNLTLSQLLYSWGGVCFLSPPAASACWFMLGVSVMLLN